MYQDDAKTIELTLIVKKKKIFDHCQAIGISHSIHNKDAVQISFNLPFFAADDDNDNDNDDDEEIEKLFI